MEFLNTCDGKLTPLKMKSFHQSDAAFHSFSETYTDGTVGRNSSVKMCHAVMQWNKTGNENKGIARE